MAKRDEYWRLFAKTGKIQYYTLYKRARDMDEDWYDIRDDGDRDPRD